MGDVGGERGACDRHPGPRGQRAVRVRGRGFRAGGGPGDTRSWSPGVTSLLRDLVDDGLHELWRKACDLDWSSTFRLREYRDK